MGAKSRLQVFMEERIVELREDALKLAEASQDYLIRSEAKKTEADNLQTLIDEANRPEEEPEPEE